MGRHGAARLGASAIWFAALSAALGALLALPWEPAGVDSELRRDASHDAELGARVDNAAYTRTAEGIDSGGTRLDAWVYIPKGLSR
jgi:hypothetical protein